jgi:hypothetical protein
MHCWKGNKHKELQYIYRSVENLLPEGLAAVCSSLLILGRVALCPHVIRGVFDTLTRKSGKNIVSLPLQVTVGVIVANEGYEEITYTILVVLWNNWIPFKASPQRSTKVSFFRQYLILTRLLLRMQYLKNLGFEVRKNLLVELEYDFLPVPLNVPHHLLDLRDDIPGTTYGRILHVTVNTINCSDFLFAYTEGQSFAGRIAV